MNTKRFFLEMFSQARERRVEGVVFFVRATRSNSIQFVVQGKLLVHKLLTHKEAGEILSALVRHAGLEQPPSANEQQGFVLVSVHGEPQIWKVYVIPEQSGTDVLLRFQPPDPLIPMEAALELPPIHETDFAWHTIEGDQRRAAVAAAYPDDQAIAPTTQIRALLAG
jgi:hypothetical protein